MMNFLFYLCGAVMCFQSCFGQVKAVLFDCDGTLVDSEYAHYLAWEAALMEVGGDLSHDEYYQYVGNSIQKNAQLLAERIGKDCKEQIIEMKEKFYRERCQEGLPVFEETVNFLKVLASEKERLGIKIGVCSGAKKEELLFHLKKLGIEDLLDIILSGHEDLKGYSDEEGVNKPKPYIYLEAAKQLSISPNECVVIEDSAPGVIAAVTAGCFTVAIPNKYTCHQDLSRAHLRIESLNIDSASFLTMINEACAMENFQFADCNDPILDSSSRALTIEEILDPSMQRFFDAFFKFARGEQSDKQSAVLVGLAAPQIGKALRVILVDVQADGKGGVAELRLYINPEIMEISEEKETWYEACFSTGVVRGIVHRPSRVTIKALDRNGHEIQESHQGYVARIFQHEIDHLNGIRFPDRVDAGEMLHVVKSEDFYRYRNLGEWRNWKNIIPQKDWKKHVQD
ncbi:MAG: HAD-IA family hydrolase [Chlamydiota bacterium]